jgi:2-dehydropantoate 2-reductase
MIFERVAVMGAGAVGCYFGGMLARAGVPVTLIGRGPSVTSINSDGLLFDSVNFRERVELTASTEASAARGAGLVLFSVKTVDTESAARALAPHVERGAIVLSLQNGVDNAERMRAAAGIEAISTVVYVAASMPEPGHLKHVGRGDLVIGHAKRGAEVEAITELFKRAGVPCRVTENIEGELWMKLILNCSYNAISALGRSNYGRAAKNEHTREVIRATAAETVAVARAIGVKLPEGDLVETALKLSETMGRAVSSTAQDIERGKRTEIDSLNGYVVRRGKESGVPTPVNHTLFALIKLLEEPTEQALQRASEK